MNLTGGCLESQQYCHEYGRDVHLETHDGYWMSLDSGIPGVSFRGGELSDVGYSGLIFWSLREGEETGGLGEAVGC